MSPLSLLNRPGLLGCALLATLLAVSARAETPADTPNFHAFLAEVAEQATAVEITVAVNNSPSAKAKPSRIFRSSESEDIAHLAHLVAGCQEPALREGYDGVIELSPFPVPEFRYTITFKAGRERLLSVWQITPNLLQGLPAPWFQQVRIPGEAGAALWEFLQREHAFSPGAPQPSGTPSL